jgi:hypothetical protein
MKTTKIILSIYLFMAMASPFANAELAAPTTGSSSAPWPAEQQYCDSICPSLAGTNGQALGLSGSGGWSSSDDQWCANHNAQTSPTVLPVPAPVGAALPTGTCTTAQMYPGDTSCAQTTKEVTHCQYHNSQTESYCMAYEGSTQAGAGEKTVLVLDIAATAMCAADCASTALAGGVGMQVCEAGAVAAGVAEILVGVKQNSSALGKMVEGFGGAAAAAEGVMEYTGTGMGKGLSMGTQQFSNPDMMDSDMQEAQNQAKAAKNAKTDKKNACITAATLAVLTGVRYLSMHSQDGAGQKACGNVWALQSTNATVGSSGGATTPNAVSGGSTGSGGSVSGSTSTNGTAGLNCMSSGGTVSSCTGQQVSGATDGGLLANTGLGNAALPLAQQLQAQGLPSALSGSGGLGAAMGGAMGGAGDMGKALTKIAEEAAANGAQLASLAPYSGGGGGGGGGAAASDAANPFASLMGGAGGPAAGSSMQVFHGENVDTDIWHAHSDQNLFQIVSGRIGKVSPRVNNNF